MRRDTTSYVDRLALVMAAFPGSTPLTLADVSSRTGLPRSTAHRLITELHRIGWLTRTGNEFDLGMALFELGERAPIKRGLRDSALPFLQDLYSVTRQTVHLAVRVGLEAVYVEKIHGHTPLPMPSRIGGRLPLTCTAVGKALLAFEDREIIEAVVAQPLRRRTRYSITNPNVLSRELESIRRWSVAIERQEAAIGGSCVASPVMIRDQPVAALSVSVPASQFKPTVLAPAVRTAALGLGRVLANRLGGA